MLFQPHSYCKSRLSYYNYEGRQSNTSVRPKLQIGQPDDIYEKKANAVAKKVMGMLEPQFYREQLEEEEGILKEQSLVLRRKWTECKKEDGQL